MKKNTSSSSTYNAVSKIVPCEVGALRVAERLHYRGKHGAHKFHCRPDEEEPMYLWCVINEYGQQQFVFAENHKGAKEQSVDSRIYPYGSNERDEYYKSLTVFNVPYIVRGWGQHLFLYDERDAEYLQCVDERQTCDPDKPPF